MPFPEAETCDPEILTPEILSLKASKTEKFQGIPLKSTGKEIFSFQDPEKNFLFCFGVCPNHVIVDGQQKM